MLASARKPIELAVLAVLLLGLWLIWGDPNRWTLTLLAAGGIALVLHPKLGLYALVILSPLQAFDFGSGLLSVTRLVGIGVVSLMVARFVLQRKPLLATGFEGPVFMMICGVGLSLFRTDPDEYKILISVLSFVSLYSFALVAVNLVETEKDLSRLTIVLMVSALVPISLALSQWLAFSDWLSVIHRVAGSFTGPSGLGSYLVLTVLMAFSLSLSGTVSTPLRLAFISVFISGQLALVASFARSAWIGVAMGALTILLVFVPRLRLSRLPVGLLISLTAASLVIIFTVWPLVDSRLVTPIVDLIETGESTRSVQARLDEFSFGLALIVDNNFLGTGVGKYTESVLEIRATDSLSVVPSVPHNIIVYFFGEVGLVGGLGFLWMAVSLFRRARRYHRRTDPNRQGLSYFVFVGSAAALIGYLSLLSFLGGPFTNEIWLAAALLVVSMRIGDRDQLPSSQDQAHPSPAHDRRSVELKPAPE